jgi:EAL domain-containing protein (putative c-di-GMP-specific phosphodiesterase class I)
MIFTPEIRSGVQKLLRRGFYAIAFQPIYRMNDRTIFGFEALLRGPEGTLLAQPGRIFLSGMIDRELLHEIDTACMLSAVRSGRILAASHRLFVNVHGETLFRFSSRMRDLLHLLDILHLEAGNIVLEISETTEKSHVRSIARSIEPLRERGMQIALDDVGARYAWLHHMLWLQPEFLKIDRVFVRNVHRSPRKQKLIEAIGGMARTVGCDVIVEGVEREEEAEAIKKLDIDFGQGFLLGRPLPAQHWIGNGENVAELASVAGLWSYQEH